MSKAQKFCAYRERCVAEMEIKLSEWGLSQKDLDAIIDELVETSFINEDRFILSYTRGKFANNKWGRGKIRQSLRMKKFDDDRIEKALSKLDNTQYEKVARRLIERKLEKIASLEKRSRHSKTYYYMLSKGYEASIIIPILNELNPE